MIKSGQSVIDPYTGEEAFAVEPITNCPHALQLDSDKLTKRITTEGQKLFNGKCGECKNIGENWMCLSCEGIFCSRYVEGHMASHNENNRDHCVVLSFSDLSFWCYSCDTYITNANLSQIRKLFQKVKFNENSDDINECSRQKAIHGKGFFLIGDINQSQVHQTILLSQPFPGEYLKINKGAVLKGYELSQENSGQEQYPQKKEDSQIVGSLLTFTSQADSIAREKIVYLVNEIEGFPKHSDITFETVMLGESQFDEIAIYVSR